MTARKSPKMLAIETEWDQPFWDVVAGFAKDGESIQATAGILGYSSSAFRRLVQRHKHDVWFTRGQDTAGAKAARKSRRGKVTPGMRRALDAASASNPTYLKVTVEGVTDTLAGHARRRGLSVRTVYNRTYRGLPIEQALSISKLYVSRPVSRSHHWRDSAEVRA